MDYIEEISTSSRIQPGSDLVEKRDEIDFRRQDSRDSSDVELAKQYAKKNFFQKYMLETATSFFTLAIVIVQIPMNDIYMRKVCLYNLQFNSSVCEHMNDNLSIKDSVQFETKYYTMANQLVATVPGAVISLISGQYMARYGVKNPLIMCMTGSLITAVLQCYTFYYMPIPLMYSVLSLIPSALTGGGIVVLTALYTNIAHSCPSDVRKVRFLVVYIFMFAPLLISMAIGGPIYVNCGIFVIGVIGGSSLIVAITLIALFFEDMETFKTARLQDSFLEVVRHSASLKTLKQSYSYVVRSRPAHARAQLNCMIVSITISTIGFTAVDDLNYLYFNRIYRWGPEKISTMNAVMMAIVFVFSMPTMLFFTKIWKLKDPLMAAFGDLCFALRFGIFSVLSLGKFFFYLQNFVGLPFMVGITAARSHVSRLLLPHEVSVIFALVAALEKLVPIASDLLVTFIYDSTLDTFPGMVYLFISGIYIISLVLALITAVLLNRFGLPKYDDEETLIEVKRDSDDE